MENIHLRQFKVNLRNLGNEVLTIIQTEDLVKLQISGNLGACTVLVEDLGADGINIYGDSLGSNNLLDYAEYHSMQNDEFDS